MIIALFKNHSGLVWGDDVKTISAEKSGVLAIGDEKVTVKAHEKSLMPLLYYGASGDFPAKYTTARGVEYDLGNVTVRLGRIVSPPPYVVEIMELRLRADNAEAKIEELSNIFDTDALNFLIK